MLKWIKIKYVLMIVPAMILCGSGKAQQSVKDDFDYLVQKIKNDYPGYHDKFKPDLLILENSLRTKIKVYPDSVFHYFNQYTAYFKDIHLRVERVYQRDSYVSKENDVSSFGRNVPIGNLIEHKGDNSIIGVWTSLCGDIAIMNNPDDSDVFLGVSIDFNDFSKGNVVYEFISANDTVFNVLMHSMYEGRKPINLKASLELERKILEIHDRNMYFTKKSDSKFYDNALLGTYRPKHPNGRNIYPMASILDDSTFYIRLLSFADTKDYITKLINKHWDAIINRPNLIIDIRMNNGGQSDAYEVLAPLMYTNPFKIKGVEWYASKGNIAHIEKSMRNNDVRDGEVGLKWIQALVNEMKTNIGGYVIHPYYQKETLVSMDTVYINPKNIGIIIEKSNASAAEQFLLYAKNSQKVILFGNESTAGVLDYSNVTPNDFPSNKYELYCPMTRSLRLPENPIDNIGISPDIQVPFPPTKDLFNRLDDWVYFVMCYLNELND